MEERPKFLPKMVSGEIRRKTDPVSEQLHKSQNGLYRGSLCLFLGLSLLQPRPQGFSLKKWVGREKALASAGHVSPRIP